MTQPPDTAVFVSTHTERGAKAGAAAGAAGIGLVRTELMFVGWPHEPSVTEQARAYQSVLLPFAGRDAVVRVWDLGADKVVPFVPAPAGPNPALGERGVRLLRDNPSLLDRQLAAIATAGAAARVAPSVVAPMVAVPEEAAWFAERVRRHGLHRVGVMIELPSAVMLARELLDVADFVAIGTNDLLQYAHGADRCAGGSLAVYADPWQPALLRLIRLVVDAAADAGRPVQVCGDAAAEPAFAAVLAGLGVASVSVGAHAVPAVLRVLDAAGVCGCRQAYAAAASAAERTAARTAAHAVLPPVGAPA